MEEAHHDTAQDSKRGEYESESFEEYSASASFQDAPPRYMLSGENNECITKGHNSELGTLSWTWTPLSRDVLYEANAAMVRTSLE